MRAQGDRDQRTVTIATALGLFCVVVALGIASEIVLGRAGDGIFWTSALLGTGAGATYLVLHRHR